VPVPQSRQGVLFEEAKCMWLRISPDMDFYLETELQGVTDKTSDYDIQQYEKVIYDEFVKRLKKAFPEGDFKIYMLDFGIAREKNVKTAA
jgi:hypothetical protein